uniref:Small ribosomal subunit protein uS3c n=1 Tax=Interfilum terricola TaxID=163310 RepID=A0A097KPL6_9VIRI|nr:ribosomal protein S3 [Interfilum terricola]AIT95134.1 ribosomal protein S3 [Interfilum terricola]
MGQKIHPLGFRLGIIQKHRSQWFAKSINYPKLILEDNFLRKIILKKFKDAGIIELSIQRKLDQISIDIKTARPGIILGRDGDGLEILQKYLENQIKKYRSKTLINLENSIQIALHITELSSPDSHAAFIAEYLVEQLEKRIPFRRAVRQAIQRAQRARIQGIKIQISGRLNGAEIARSEWVREGRVPLQTLRADIDYSYKTAKTIYGLLGIKVWIFRGEVFNK